MMGATQRNRKFVADFSAQRARLRKSEVMSVRRTLSTNQARLSGHKQSMRLIASPHRLADQHFRWRRGIFVFVEEGGVRDVSNLRRFDRLFDLWRKGIRGNILLLVIQGRICRHVAVGVADRIEYGLIGGFNRARIRSDQRVF